MRPTRRAMMISTAALLAPQGSVAVVVWLVTLLALAALGAIGAIAGGARIGRGIVRVLVWGSAAMAITSGIGHVFGIAA